MGRNYFRCGRGIATYHHAISQRRRTLVTLRFFQFSGLAFPRDYWIVPSRCRLTFRAKVAAAASDDNAPDRLTTSHTRVACPLIHTVPVLKFTALPFRVHIIRD